MQWQPQLIRHYTTSWRCYRAAWTLLQSFTYSICQILPKVFVLQWVRYANNDVYSSGHLVLSRLGLTDVLLVEISDTLNHTLIQLVAFSQTWIITNFDLITQYRFHRAFTTDVACQKKTFTHSHPDTIMILSHLVLAEVLLLRFATLFIIH